MLSSRCFVPAAFALRCTFLAAAFSVVQVLWVGTMLAQDSEPSAIPSAASDFACPDESNPWYPHKSFPKLLTPQWVGEDGVEAVIVLAIDDMRDPAKYEAWLRPVLNRLKQIDGRAPVSIMTNEVKADDAQLQSWLGEGLSIECHTIDHPCPILQGGDFAKAKSTYDRCVDLMGQIPNNKPVAFRMPCCDSLNTVSPRFFSEIFSGTTENGNVLQIDSSVFMFYTSEDESLPKDRVLDSNGKERFWKYLPKNNKYAGNTHDTFVNYIKNYPYPYVINNSCWEIPCLAPSDWSAQHLHGVHNPMTVDDWKAAIDLTVHKQGCFSLVFHPHGWIKPEQVVEMIDHAVAKHGNKVKFLNFREVAERLEKAESGERKAEFVGSKRRYEQTHNCEELAAARALVKSKEFDQWWNGETQSPPFGLKPIRRPDGTPNGFFIHDRHFCWINEDTAKLPDLMYRVSFDEVLAAAQSGRHSPSDEPAKHDDASDVNGKATNKEVTVHHSESDGDFDPVPIGAAVVDITPDYPVRLTGYGNRLKESEGVAVKIHARAMVIGTLASGRASALRDQAPPRTVDISDSTEEQGLNRNETHGSDTRRADALPLAILITVDNCGVPLEMTEAVYARIAAKHNIPRANFAICSTHSHSAPWLRGFAPNIFAEVPDDHAAHLAQYENELTDKLVEVVEQAIANQRPGHLSLGYGETGFAMNRRSLQEGKWVGFGEVPDGPTDKRVPVLAAHDADGKLIAVLANYACHCTTETGEFNQISGDWAGFAADMLEADFPGAVALIAIGCGADANPSPRGSHEQAKGHGRTMADEVKRVMASGRALALRDHAQQSALPSAQGRGQNEASANNAKIAAAVSSPEEEQNALGGLTPSRSPNASLHRINPAIRGSIARIDLPLAPIPTRAEWEEAAKRPGVEGSRARYFLKMLEDGQEIPTTVPNYPVQTWCFGDDLAMVFLGGEVVVDYSIRMNDMFVSDRLWINAYSNDVPCYIASARLLREGGYECDSSMLYYRRPTRLAPEAEDLICDTVQKLLPHSFYSEALQKDFPAPKAPEESLKCMTTRPDLRIVLAASEPLIRDPVAFDWDERGRLWVVEMGDYPEGHSMASGRALALREPASGFVESGQSVDALGGLTPSRSPEHSGRVRLLEDTDHNGVYDKATTFLDNLAFPNGIHCWRGGVIVTMAPEVFYAEDTNGDNVADVRKTLYRGFVEGNQQHRINGLRWGLDGWLYLANGDSGGLVEGTGLTPETQASGRASALRESAPETADTEQRQNALGGLTPNRSPVSLRGRDLRINPDTNELDAVSGQTQFGRERDDFGNWFGNNNSNPIYQFVLEDHYVRRNPHASISQVIAQVAAIPGAAPVYPTSRTLARFNDFAYANRFTSACSTMIYRDTYLGEQYYGNAFTCEPVHNLVSRLVLTRDGYGFKGERAPDEQQSEFLASSDNWFRPTMVRTGPDGAIWVADMYRAVIEHPEWIPAEYQRKMNLYAGNDMGRIYRIVPASECCGSASGRASALRDNAPIAENQEQQNAHGGLTPNRSPGNEAFFDKPWNEIPLEALTKRLESPNGWWRDTAQRILTHRRKELYDNMQLPKDWLSKSPQAKVQIAATFSNIFIFGASHLETGYLAGLGSQVFLPLLEDADPRVRQASLKILETVISGPANDAIEKYLMKLGHDPDAGVKLQLCLVLGGIGHDGKLLGQLLRDNFEDPYIRSAALSSLYATPPGLRLTNLDGVIAAATDDAHGPINEELVAILLEQAVALGYPEAIAEPVKTLLKSIDDTSPASRLNVLRSVLDKTLRASALEVIQKSSDFAVVMKTICDTSERIARDETTSSDRRSAAYLLAMKSGKFIGRPPMEFSDFLSPQTPLEIQIAAVGSIGVDEPTNSLNQLASRWNSLAPGVRAVAIAKLMQRESSVDWVLERIRKGDLSSVDLDAGQRDQLVHHRNEKIAAKAKELFDISPTTARSAVVDDFKSQISNFKFEISKEEQIVSGKRVFEKRCATCHRLQDVGKEVGADLAALKDRSTDSLLTAILDPNKAVEAKFLTYTVVTKEGLQYSGMLKSETGGSMTLIGSDGVAVTIPRANIEELVSTKRSLMPEGLEKDLTVQDLASVVAFVQSTGTPWKRFDGNGPRTVQPDAEGTITLPAAAAEIYGPNLVFESKYGNLGFWTSTDDYAKWTFDVPTDGFWTVELDFACDDSTAGSLIRFSTGTRMLTARVPGTGSWDNYETYRAGTIDLHEGKGQLILTAPSAPPFALIDLKAVRLIPPGK